MFLNLIGHEREKEYLKTLIERDFSGTHLFYGPPSVGKRTAAFETAKIILCENKKGDECFCRSCKKFNSEHPDFFYTGREKIKVEDIDQLLDFMSLKPLISDKKIAIIDNAENITMEASNRLLKVLEEPPKGFAVILVTSNPQALLPTVLYRCLKIEFKALEKRFLITIFSKKLGFEIPQAVVLAGITSFAVVDVFSKAGLYIKYRDMAVEFVSVMKNKSLIDLLDFVDKIDRSDLDIFVDMLVLVLTDIAMLQNNFFDIVNKDKEKDLFLFVSKFNKMALAGILNILSQIKRYIYLNVNMNLVLKTAIIKSHPLISAGGNP